MQSMPRNDRAVRLYERSLAGQWNADRGVDWRLSTIVATPEIDAERADPSVLR
jgi:hypothetical protein